MRAPIAFPRRPPYGSSDSTKKVFATSVRVFTSNVDEFVLGSTSHYIENVSTPSIDDSTPHIDDFALNVDNPTSIEITAPPHSSAPLEEFPTQTEGVLLRLALPCLRLLSLLDVPLSLDKKLSLLRLSVESCLLMSLLLVFHSILRIVSTNESMWFNTSLLTRYPSSYASTISTILANLIYLVGASSPIDVGQFVFNHILRHVEILDAPSPAHKTLTINYCVFQGSHVSNIAHNIRPARRLIKVIQSLGCLIHGLIESRTTVDSLLQSLTKLLPTDGAGTSG
ncbi:uncharacterized protein E5676_scaffold325G00340 [Cucumis melo var. makuwa]|uniref:Flocculation protein FLO11-like n=2 Tax=Cucumis melo TaxID=3656 RepID=A0A5D3DV34_CUCMM|nr:uncharacterized protein E5676_scaffold325G00340 [Cucumis melo var. makuwa]